MRWSLEVVFKDCKQNLGLGKYQMRNFSSQIAMTVITAMQYNLLSAARRFTDYETIGGLFKDVMADSVQLTITEKIRDTMIELVREMAKASISSTSKSSTCLSTGLINCDIMLSLTS